MVVLHVIGALAGLAPLLAVVELGRTLLSPGPIDHDHVWTVVIAGAAGLSVRLLLTAASSGLGLDIANPAVPTAPADAVQFFTANDLPLTFTPGQAQRYGAVPVPGCTEGGPGSNGAESNEPSPELVLFGRSERLTIFPTTVRTGFGAVVEVGGRWRFSSSPTSRWSGFGRIRTSAGRS
ncbi:hypothetical protein ACQEVF_47270 [Nonomuraea polychroma]|uniref:hypothetical protein n=1 Tax=Nonomuraea polychroma TaxID=46176 RepID=UPI003D945B81